MNYKKEYYWGLRRIPIFLSSIITSTLDTMGLSLSAFQNGFSPYSCFTKAENEFWGVWNWVAKNLLSRLQEAETRFLRSRFGVTSCERGSDHSSILGIDGIIFSDFVRSHISWWGELSIPYKGCGYLALQKAFWVDLGPCHEQSREVKPFGGQSGQYLATVSGGVTNLGINFSV